MTQSAAETAVAYGPRKKDELLAEFHDLESRIWIDSEALHTRRELLEKREEALLAARDLTWLRGTKGTTVEQERLLKITGGLAQWAPSAGKLVVRLQGYRRWSMKPTWQRPRVEDWQRTVNAVLRELRVIVRDQTAAQDRDWALYSRRYDQHQVTNARYDELLDILGAEAYPSYGYHL